MVDILYGWVGVYIYISIDLIYEVCEKNYFGFSIEEDVVWLKSLKKCLEFKREEKYVYDKLVCEEVFE